MKKSLSSRAPKLQGGIYSCRKEHIVIAIRNSIEKWSSWNASYLLVGSGSLCKCDLVIILTILLSDLPARPSGGLTRYGCWLVERAWNKFSTIRQILSLLGYRPEGQYSTTLWLWCLEMHFLLCLTTLWSMKHCSTPPIFVQDYAAQATGSGLI